MALRVSRFGCRWWYTPDDPRNFPGGRRPGVFECVIVVALVVAGFAAVVYLYGPEIRAMFAAR